MGEEKGKGAQRHLLARRFGGSLAENATADSVEDVCVQIMRQIENVGHKTSPSDSVLVLFVGLSTAWQTSL